MIKIPIPLFTLIVSYESTYDQWLFSKSNMVQVVRERERTTISNPGKNKRNPWERDEEWAMILGEEADIWRDSGFLDTGNSSSPSFSPSFVQRPCKEFIFVGMIIWIFRACNCMIFYMKLMLNWLDFVDIWAMLFDLSCMWLYT